MKENKKQPQLYYVSDGENVIHKDLTLYEAECRLCLSINRGAEDSYLCEQDSKEKINP